MHHCGSADDCLEMAERLRLLLGAALHRPASARRNVTDTRSVRCERPADCAGIGECTMERRCQVTAAIRIAIWIECTDEVTTFHSYEANCDELTRCLGVAGSHHRLIHLHAWRDLRVRDAWHHHYTSNGCVSSGPQIENNAAAPAGFGAGVFTAPFTPKRRQIRAGSEHPHRCRSRRT